MPNKSVRGGNVVWHDVQDDLDANEYEHIVFGRANSAVCTNKACQFDAISCSFHPKSK